MSNGARTLGRLACAAAVAASLAFGAREAFARPAEAARGPYCDAATCNANCLASGAEGGICTVYGCRCFY